MADYNTDKLRISDGDTIDLTFTFDNVTRCETKDRVTYYQFQCETGRFTTNNHGLRKIQQAWPGRGGSMRVTRHDSSTFTCDDVVMGRGGELSMKEWQGTGFVDIAFDLDGLGEAAPVDKPTPDGTIVHVPNPQPANQGETMEDLVNTMTDCVKGSWRAWRDGLGDNITPGDVAGAVERMAVSLYIDCRKMGITGFGVEEEPEEEGQVRVHVEGGEPVENPPPPSEPPEYGHNPGTESDDDLPF